MPARQRAGLRHFPINVQRRLRVIAQFMMRSGWHMPVLADLCHARLVRSENGPSLRLPSLRPGLWPWSKCALVAVTVVIDVSAASRMLAQHHRVLWLGLLLLLSLDYFLLMLLSLLHLSDVRVGW